MAPSSGRTWKAWIASVIYASWMVNSVGCLTNADFSLLVFIDWSVAEIGSQLLAKNGSLSFSNIKQIVHFENYDKKIDWNLSEKLIEICQYALNPCYVVLRPAYHRMLGRRHGSWCHGSLCRLIIRRIIAFHKDTFACSTKQFIASVVKYKCLYSVPKLYECIDTFQRVIMKFSFMV